MKSQSLSQSQQESLQTTHITGTSTQFSQQNVQCSQKGSTKFACITRSCPNQAFLCENQNCSCQSLHENCMIIKTQRITKNIKRKIISVQPLENIINKNVDELIDFLSQNRDKVLSDLREKFQFLGLTDLEKDLLKALTKNEKLDASGHQLWQIHRSLTLSSSILDQSLKNIGEQFNLLKSEISIKFTQIEKKFNHLLYQISSNLKCQEDILNEAYSKCINSQSALSLKSKNQQKFFQKSKIVQQNQVQKIINFFEPRKIKSSTLLYRASENSFKISKFHQNCNQFTNNITFCATQFDKKIGGFTCLDWTPVKGGWKEDLKSESFVFSLTSNDKFTLKDKQRAIFSFGKNGPDFGSDFCLREQANMRSDSYADINTDYFNSKYTKNDKNSWKSFSGRQSKNFKAKEWQFWHLQFE